MRQIYEKIRLWFNLSNEIKKEIIEKNFGEPIKLLEKKVYKYSSCSINLPSEYCSKDNLQEIKIILTNKGLKIKIEEIYEGLNFEAPCDKYKYTIYKI